ncbi:hypothetical protein D3C71_1863750 [compost metagenome]
MLHLRFPHIHYNRAAGCRGQPVKGKNIRYYVNAGFQLAGIPDPHNAAALHQRFLHPLHILIPLQGGDALVGRDDIIRIAQVKKGGVDPVSNLVHVPQIILDR